MHEPAMKGLEGLESEGSDAKIRKSSIRRISVEGYDTSLGMEDVDEALRKHFASCGKIIHVSIPRNNEWTVLCKYAFVYFNEEDEEKALRLDGSDMGGQILQIKSYPFHETYLNDVLDPMKEARIRMHQHTLKVTGYDNSLPLDDVETEIEKYFSAYGSLVYHHHKTSSGATKIKAYISLNGLEAVDKALELSGRSVGGLNLVVTKVEPIPKNPEKSGYIPPRILARLTKEQIEDPNLYYIIEGNQKKSDTSKGNQKKKSKTRERNQKKKKS
ncbi:hypothetical protein Bca4012_009011 [Brassica carinata]